MAEGDRLAERFWQTTVGFLAIVAGFCAAPASSQDFSAGKTAAQLFASDCAACHKSPAGLAKGQSAGSLTSFLREHYTTKPESAAALAAYLLGAGPGNARVSPQAPVTGPKARNAEGNEEKPAPRPRQAPAASAEADKQPDAEASPPAAPREAAKPQVDPMVTKLNGYAAARGEPKDTARLATPTRKLDSYANSGSAAEGVTPADEPNAKRKPSDKKKKDTTASTGDTAAPHSPRPRRAQTPIIQSPPGNN
jgi:hypothetical protein